MREREIYVAVVIFGAAVASVDRANFLGVFGGLVRRIACGARRFLERRVLVCRAIF